MFVNLLGTITQINISFEKNSISLFVTLHIFFPLNKICISYKIISYINMIVTIVFAIDNNIIKKLFTCFKITHCH